MPRARVGEIELEYVEEGRGEPLILVMGIGAQLIHWHDELCGLLARRFRVVRFDNRDAGRSSRLDHLGVPNWRQVVARAALGLPVEAPYSLSDMAADTVGLMDALGIDSAHVVGTSMGGMIAQTVAIEHPERVRTLTSMMSTPGGRRFGLPRPRALRALFGRRPPRSADEASEFALEFSRVCGSKGYERDEPYVRGLAARAFERGINPRGFVRQFAAIAKSGSRRTRLPAVRAPTLVIHGSVDPLIPPAGGRGTARLVPGARLRLVEGMGHDLPRGVWPLIADGVSSLAVG